jgi:hypothetical protein
MDNDSDIFTKNVSGDIYKMHNGKLLKIYKKGEACNRIEEDR